ncbi:MAG: pyrimidine-nucleoside phosphorylase, partial [Halanaerobiaceae bacterium]
KVGERVEKGDPLVEVYYNKDKNLDQIISKIKNAYNITKDKKDDLELIYRVIK